MNKFHNIVYFFDVESFVLFRFNYLNCCIELFGCPWHGFKKK